MAAIVERQFPISPAGLPNEILSTIFRYLPRFQDGVSFGRTCRTMYFCWQINLPAICKTLLPKTLQETNTQPDLALALFDIEESCDQLQYIRQRCPSIPDHRHISRFWAVTEGARAAKHLRESLLLQKESHEGEDLWAFLGKRDFFKIYYQWRIQQARISTCSDAERAAVIVKDLELADFTSIRYLLHLCERFDLEMWPHDDEEQFGFRGWSYHSSTQGIVRLRSDMDRIWDQALRDNRIFKRWYRRFLRVLRRPDYSVQRERYGRRVSDLIDVAALKLPQRNLRTLRGVFPSMFGN